MIQLLFTLLLASCACAQEAFLYDIASTKSATTTATNPPTPVLEWTPTNAIATWRWYEGEDEYEDTGDYPYFLANAPKSTIGNFFNDGDNSFATITGLSELESCGTMTLIGSFTEVSFEGCSSLVTLTIDGHETVLDLRPAYNLGALSAITQPYLATINVSGLTNFSFLGVTYCSALTTIIYTNNGLSACTTFNLAYCNFSSEFLSTLITAIDNYGLSNGSIYTYPTVPTEGGQTIAAGMIENKGWTINWESW